MRNRMMIMAIVGIMLLVVGCSTQRYDTEYVRDANWTSDGKIVYLVEKKSTWIQKNPIYEHQVKKETSVSLWECDSDGNNKEEKGIVKESWADIAYYGMSSVGNKVVMSMVDIFVMNRNGSGLTKIGTKGFYPSMSPDGSKVVYKEWGGGIRMMNIDGSNDHIFLDDTSLTGPQWSPDGGYISTSQHNVRIKIYDLNGELKKILDSNTISNDSIYYFVANRCWDNNEINMIYTYISFKQKDRSAKIKFNFINDSLEIDYYPFIGGSPRIHNDKIIAYYGDLLVSNIDSSNIWYLYTLLND